jgi:hypothetical protein
MSRFKDGDVIVGDRRFAGAKLYVDYARAGLHHIIRAHQRLKVGRLRVLMWLGRDDFIMLMPVQKMYRHKDPTLPDNIEVRIILNPFLKLHAQERFKNHLVILSEKRAKWIRTA